MQKTHQLFFTYSHPEQDTLLQISGHDFCKHLLELSVCWKDNCDGVISGWQAALTIFAQLLPSSAPVSPHPSSKCLYHLYMAVSCTTASPYILLIISIFWPLKMHVKHKGCIVALHSTLVLTPVCHAREFTDTSYTSLVCHS